MKLPKISLRFLWMSGMVLFVVIAVVSIIPGPYVETLSVSRTDAILQSAQFGPESTAVLLRACGNCHSNQTKWPPYSRVAPVSWLIRKDVNEGRKFLNFSVWPEYGVEGQGQLLAASLTQIKSGQMPPARYALLHSEAKLGDQERSDLLEAMERELSRLSKPMPSKQ